MGGRRAAGPKFGQRPPPPVLEVLREATEGLTYPSESDAPFDVFLDDNATSAEEVIATQAPGGKATAFPMERFFAELEGSEQGERYGRLRQVLDANLSSLAVFRVGSMKVDVYLVGRTPGGGWAGLHTTSVET